MSTYDQLRARLRAQREHQGLSQRTLASAIGVSTSTLANWETGTAEASAPNLIAWAAGLGSTIELGDPHERAEVWLDAMRTVVPLVDKLRNALADAIEKGPSPT